MPKPIMNLDEVVFDDVEENGKYTSKRGRIGAQIGARKLGYNLTVLPPGKIQCPFHCHHGEEEMFLILEGEGELRFGEQRYPIRKHDVTPARRAAGGRAPTSTRHDHDALPGVVPMSESTPAVSRASGKMIVTGQSGIRVSQDVSRREHRRLYDVILLEPDARVATNYLDNVVSWHSRDASLRRLRVARAAAVSRPANPSPSRTQIL